MTSRAPEAIEPVEAMPIPLMQAKVKHLTDTLPVVLTRPRRLRSALLAVALGLALAPVAAVAAAAVHKLGPLPAGAGEAMMQGVVAAPDTATPPVPLAVPADTVEPLDVPIVAPPTAAPAQPPWKPPWKQGTQLRRRPAYDPKEI
jgi:hypothetical protein